MVWEALADARPAHTIHRHCYDGDDRPSCLGTEGANPIEQEKTN